MARTSIYKTVSKDEPIISGDNWTSRANSAIKEFALEEGLDPYYCMALAHCVSGFNPYYMKLDKDWLDILTKGTGRAFLTYCDKATEIYCMATRWGLFGVLGMEIREHGGHHPFLSAVLELDNNVFYGIKRIKRLYDIYKDYNLVSASWGHGKPKFISSTSTIYRGDDFIRAVEIKTGLLFKKMGAKQDD